VYRRSLLSNRDIESLRLQHARLARTPPSTFLFLHLHLSNSPGWEPQPSMRRAKPSIRRQTPTDNYRLGLHASRWRAFKDATPCLGKEPRHCRAQWVAYRPAGSRLSTPVVNKSSHVPKESRRAKSPGFSGVHAALEPQSCVVLSTSNRGIRGNPNQGFVQIFLPGHW